MPETVAAEFFKRHVITKDGLEYLADQQAMKFTPELTRAVAGEGFVEWEELESQTVVTNPVAVMQMDERIVLDKKVVKLPLRLMNTALDDSVLIRMIGVYARHPQKGEILYQLLQYSVPQPVPSLKANSGEIYVYNIDIDVMFANSEAAKIPSDPGWFVSRKEFNEANAVIGALVERHIGQIVFSEEGVHGLRYWENKWQVKNEGGEWEITTGGGSGPGGGELSDGGFRIDDKVLWNEDSFGTITPTERSNTLEFNLGIAFMTGSILNLGLMDTEIVVASALLTDGMEPVEGAILTNDGNVRKMSLSI